MSEIDNKNHAVALTIVNRTTADMVYLSDFFNPGRLEEGSDMRWPQVIRAGETHTIHACNRDNDPIGVSFDVQYAIYGERVVILAENIKAQSNKIGIAWDELGKLTKHLDDHGYEARSHDFSCGHHALKVKIQCSKGSINRAQVELWNDTAKDAAFCESRAQTAKKQRNDAAAGIENADKETARKVDALREKCVASIDELEFYLDQSERRSIQGTTMKIEAFELDLVQADLDRAGPFDLAIYADTVRLGGRLEFPGKNIAISVRVLELTNDSEIDTSVSDAALGEARFLSLRNSSWHDYSKLKGGKPSDPGLIPSDGSTGSIAATRSLDGPHGEDGASGLDGSDGVDGGNITLMAGAITGPERKLRLVSNGGRGGRGQDGGKGGNGGDGKRDASSYSYSNAGKLPGSTALASTRWWSKSHGRGGCAGNGGDAGKSGRGGPAGLISVSMITPVARQGGPRVTFEAKGGPGGAPASGGVAGIAGRGDEVGSFIDTEDGEKAKKIHATGGWPGVAGRSGVAGEPGPDAPSAEHSIKFENLYLAKGARSVPASSLAQWRIAFRAAKALYLKGSLDRARSLFSWLESVVHASHAEPPHPDEAKLVSVLRAQILVRLEYLDLGLDYFGRSFEYVPVLTLDACASHTEGLLTTADAVEKTYKEIRLVKRQQEAQLRQIDEWSREVGSRIGDLGNQISSAVKARSGVEERLAELWNSLNAQELAMRKAHAHFLIQVSQAQGMAMLTSVMSLAAQTVMIATGNYAAAQLIGTAGGAVGTGLKAIEPLISSEKAISTSSVFKGASESFAKLAKNAESLEKEMKGLKPKDESVEIRRATKEETLSWEGSQITRKTDVVISKPQKTSPDAIATASGAILQVIPIVEGLGDVIKVAADISETQERYGFDAVKLAMEKKELDKLVEKASAYVQPEKLNTFKAAFETYSEIARQRNDLLIQYRTDYLKAVEADAKLCQARAETALLRSGRAGAGDERLLQLHAFWLAVYDSYRDRTLDSIYEEYRAFRYYALSDGGFTASMAVVDDDSRGLPAPSEIAVKFAGYAADQSVATLRLLHDKVKQQAKAAQEKSFKAHQDVKNRLIVFGEKEECLERFKAEGKVLIALKPDHPALDNLGRFYMSSVKVFIPGLRQKSGESDEIDVTIELDHSGCVMVKDLDGSLHSFRHEPTSSSSSGATAIYKYTMRKLREPGKDGTRTLKENEKQLTVRTDDEYFYLEKEAPSFDVKGKKHISLSPFTTWTLELPEESNPGIDRSSAREIVFQFIGKGNAISARKKKSKGSGTR